MSQGNQTYLYLNKIHSPEDLKALPSSAMPPLAEEIRAELVKRVCANGGHLASNLGVVELTLAIHRVFDSPKDHIIFDVGHQSYVHKMLTGRLEQMETLRQSGGLSGFTNRSESEHDCFGAGHSSTSLSAGLGFAISDQLEGMNAYTVVIVGDGAYTGGMIHEALNNCRKNLPLIIILNENEMSISKNIGRFAANLAKIRTTSGYFKTKKATGTVLNHIPLIGKFLFRLIRGIKIAIKNVMYGSNYFESMGLTYLGPVDGNDCEAVETLLREAKKLNESVVVHIKTKKGKGYQPAEDEPATYHGVTPHQQQSCAQTFSTTMGEQLCEMAKEDGKICAITAAMADGTGLVNFREQFSDRFFDVGIAEEHGMTFAAGLAANGMHPYIALYSTFLQRAVDNVIHDVALQNLPVTICVDRAGLNAADGATHHGIFDVALLSQIPGIRIYTPATYGMLRASMQDAARSNCPCAIRYPSGVEKEQIRKHFYPNGDTELCGAVSDFALEDKPDVVIITHGRITQEALLAAKEAKNKHITVGIILLEMLKPYETLAQKVATMISHSNAPIIFLEEEIMNGGMGMLLRHELQKHIDMRMRRSRIMAVEDHFVTDRKSEETIFDSARISAPYILKAIEELTKEA